MNIKSAMLFVTGSMLLSTTPAFASPMGLTSQDMAFCAAVRDNQLREATTQNSAKNWGANLSINIFSALGGGGSGGVNSSSTSTASRNFEMQNYAAKNCDMLLQQAGQVSIADINANKDVAIARIQNEGHKYSEDTKRIIASMGLQAHKDDNKTQRIGIFGGIGAQIATALIGAGVEKRRIEATVQIASITADPNLALLQKWGLQQIPCMANGVAILIDDKKFCTQPTNWLTAGTYRYNRAGDQLEAANPPTIMATPESTANQPASLPQVVAQPNPALSK
jgi:hypothetical protein